MPTRQVITVFQKRALAIEFYCLDSIRSTLQRTIPSYTIEMSKLESRLVPPTVSPTPTSQTPTASSNNAPTHLPQRHNQIPSHLNPEDCIIFYIGGESLGLTNILLTYSTCEVRNGIARLHSLRRIVTLYMIVSGPLLRPPKRHRPSRVWSK